MEPYVPAHEPAREFTSRACRAEPSFEPSRKCLEPSQAKARSARLVDSTNWLCPKRLPKLDYISNIDNILSLQIGIDGLPIVTTMPTTVWVNARESVKVPARMVLGNEVSKRLDYTLFENKGKYFLVQSKNVKYL